MRRAIVGGMLALICIQASAQAAFLCIADKATGFAFKNGRWQSVDFNATDSKYVLTQKDGHWSYKKFGEPYPTQCDANFSDSGFLSCDAISKFLMNKESLRYQIVYPIGYVVGKGIKDDNGNTPYLEIGRCTAM